MSEDLLPCYNKGCGQQYKEEENTENSCRHHPGGPIFHDALKGWSCCKKRTSDFTEFLNIPGCTTGRHCNVKPAPPPSTANQNQSKGDESGEGGRLRKAPVAMVRPSRNEKLLQLPLNVSDSLKQALDKQPADADDTASSQSGVVSVGSNCKNNGCTVTYTGEDSNIEACIYHPGVPIFHEGMKYWSCCEQKTTDFNSFLSQQGCCTGRHLWIKHEEKSKSTQTSCRFDWHQTATHVTITIFSKEASPPHTVISANKVFCQVEICFDKTRKVFKQDFLLKGIIDPERSSVKMMASKVEVALRKMETGIWSSLILPS